MAGCSRLCPNWAVQNLCQELGGEQGKKPPVLLKLLSPPVTTGAEHPAGAAHRAKERSCSSGLRRADEDCLTGHQMWLAGSQLVWEGQQLPSWEVQGRPGLCRWGFSASEACGWGHLQAEQDQRDTPVWARADAHAYWHS